MDYEKLDIVLDDWQKKVLETAGNVLLFSGRRIGKSEILVIDASEYAANNTDRSVLVISHTERQAYWLFEKIINYLYRYYPQLLAKGGKHKPTKSEVVLKNHTIIRCLPTGLTGSGIRGIPAHRIYPDELDFIEEAVWSTITPMLLDTGGVIRGGSTPNPDKKVEESYVYNHMEKNPKFTVFEISTEDVINQRPISSTWTLERKQAALEHLEQEKLTMSKQAWLREYGGKRSMATKRFISDELIVSQNTESVPERIEEGKYYLGVDVARMGYDFSSFQVVRKISKTQFVHVWSESTSKTKTTDTYDKILELDNKYHFQKIGLDAGSGSLGVGLLDFLMRNSQVANRIVPLNNRSRQLDRDGERKATLLKEDMYQNLRAMMEHGILKLLKNDDVIKSLKSIQYDSVITLGHSTKNYVFSHVNSDIAEALIRACHLANEDKGLNLFATHSLSKKSWQ